MASASPMERPLHHALLWRPILCRMAPGEEKGQRVHDQGKGSLPCLGCLSSDVSFAESLETLGMLRMQDSISGPLLEEKTLGRLGPEGDGRGRSRGGGQPEIGTHCPMNHCAFQVEHALVEGAKAAGAVISAVVDSIRPKSITA